MKKLLIFPLVASVFLACQPGDSSTTLTENAVEKSAADIKVETVVKKIETEEAPKTVARLSINGMGCIMACGSAIKKSLNSLDGVIVTDIDFDADRDTDFAIVEYDQAKVSSEEMVSAVNALRKGLYQVSKVEIEEYVSAKVENKPATSSGEISKLSRDKSMLEPTIDTRSITMPNLLDIFNRFIKQ